MLPGLGADIETLNKRCFQDWAVAVRQAAQALMRKHSLIILIGYSMGGALVLHTASEQRPAGLVLLAPFWSLGEGLFSFLWPVMTLMFRSVKPLKRADFSAPDVRRALGRMFNNIDIDNPSVQDDLRQTSISLNVIDQLRHLGDSAFKRAAGIDIPALVIQGTHDKVVPAFRTQRLINRFQTTAEYHEVDAGHDLIDPDSGAWAQVKDCLQVFAEKIRQQGKSRAS
jgi:pimeloyl-ACP methyl ester carboxylesterase